jgi:hypothetical protein
MSYKISTPYVDILISVYFACLCYKTHVEFVRSPTLTRDMTQITFIGVVVQTSALKLAFVVEYRPPKF